MMLARASFARRSPSCRSPGSLLEKTSWSENPVRSCCAGAAAGHASSVSRQGRRTRARRIRVLYAGAAVPLTDGRRLFEPLDDLHEGREGALDRPVALDEAGVKAPEVLVLRRVGREVAPERVDRAAQLEAGSLLGGDLLSGGGSPGLLPCARRGRG